jgi:large subunit ribosomal protein L31e
MERIYNIPLRKEFSKAPRYKKSGKSIRAIKAFITKHMKTEEVKIGKYLNELVWKNGPKNPPHKVSVKAIKEDNITKVELIDAPVEEKAEEKKTSKKEKIKEEVKEEVKEELKEEGMKEEVAEKVAEEVKEESGKEIAEKVTKKEEKVPTADELAKKNKPTKQL